MPWDSFNQNISPLHTVIDIVKVTCNGLTWQFDVKMSVQYMSFSAHADAKGIMQLIRQCEPKNIMLVHGEAAKMEFLNKKIEQEFGKLATFLIILS